MEPQQQEPDEASLQCMDPITSAPADLLQEITRHLNTADRSNWRLANKAARQAVCGFAAALAPCNVTRSATALLPQLLDNCSTLKQLSCRSLPHLHRVTGLLQLPLCLETLDISYTDVMDLSFIARCICLKRLAAENVPGCEGLESRHLAAVLKHLPRLTTLNLHYNRLRVDAARDVAAVLRNLTGLEELDIGETGRDAAATLVPAVPHLTRLRLLDLRCCRLGAPALLPTILQLTRLQQLHLNSNSPPADGTLIYLILAPALLKLSQLERLDLYDNEMGDEGIAALAPAIQQLTGLTLLSLGLNGFGLAGARALAPALRPLTRLQDLCLGSNNLGPRGAALLAPAIQELTGLQRLHLNKNALQAEGMAALAPALQRLTMLQHLDLGYNALGPEGLSLQALLPGIQQLVSLHCLNLQYNALDRDGMLLFASGVYQLTRLEQLILSGNKVDVKFGKALAHVIHTSTPGCKVSRRQ